MGLPTEQVLRPLGPAQWCSGVFRARVSDNHLACALSPNSCIISQPATPIMFYHPLVLRLEPRASHTWSMQLHRSHIPSLGMIAVLAQESPNRDIYCQIQQIEACLLESTFFFRFCPGLTQSVQPILFSLLFLFLSIYLFTYFFVYLWWCQEPNPGPQTVAYLRQEVYHELHAGPV